jgi:hypothetical protein
MKRFILLLSVCVMSSWLAWNRGFASLELSFTDPVSERQAVDDAKSILNGTHKFGIVSYTHYPNGPSYLLLLPMKYGLSTDRSLRVVPIAFSAICFGLLALGIVMHFSNLIMKIAALLVAAAFLWQPGVVLWMGSLHQHSYALALCFAGLGMGLIPRMPSWAFFGLAFLSGWMGYDFTFAFVFSIMTGRWLGYSRQGRSLRTMLAKLALDLVATCSGIALAIITHIIQNVFFFGTVKAAINDLIGSAAARAGMEVAKDLNPHYVNFLVAAGASTPHPRAALATEMITTFATRGWIAQSILTQCLQMIGATFIIIFLWSLLRRRLTVYSCYSVSLSLLIITLMACASGLTWILVMPNHARFHFHLLPRHLFVPLLIWGIGACSVIDRISVLPDRKREPL